MAGTWGQGLCQREVLGGYSWLVSTQSSVAGAEGWERALGQQVMHVYPGLQGLCGCGTSKPGHGGLRGLDGTLGLKRVTPGDAGRED